MEEFFTHMGTLYEAYAKDSKTPDPNKQLNPSNPYTFKFNQREKSSVEKWGPPSANSNAVQLPYAEGGVLTDCDLESPVLNALVQPLDSIANILPVIATTVMTVKHAFLTSLDLGSFAAPEDATICGNFPEPGNFDVCKMEVELGRITFQSRTADLTRVIEDANRGVRDDLYFVGSVRGVSAPATFDQLQDRDFVKKGAIRREVFLQAKKHNHIHSWLYWNADPTNALLQSTVVTDLDAAWRIPWEGMNLLVADDWDTKTYVTGTNCESLNSVVIDFDGTIGTDNIYARLQTLEHLIYTRARRLGFDVAMVQWAFVMHSEWWAELIKYLPCDIISDGCSSPTLNANTGGHNGANPFQNMEVFNLFERQRLANTQTVTVNGRTYPIMLDDFIPTTFTPEDPGPPIVPAFYTSTIFFLPFVVDGENVQVWRHKDYTKVASAYGQVPSQTQSAQSYGWTDGGRFLLDVKDNFPCVQVKSWTEMALIFRAPHLAGRLDNVSIAPELIELPTIAVPA
jgi:hypothetical protein